mmetsp:Transcript_14384/g.43471  ORF Transcript_14384/g.43471 Transcript_14384/m.43471 type:complete len:112 (-) Transcript_14384:835-1170(-)
MLPPTPALSQAAVDSPFLSSPPSSPSSISVATHCNTSAAAAPREQPGLSLSSSWSSRSMSSGGLFSWQPSSALHGLSNACAMCDWQSVAARLVFDLSPSHHARVSPSAAVL